ncbi:MAG: ABC transporter permease [Theionarchaea archaeon]|nr:ABC transporter permease [Theionarchaea archaeon]MBU7038831.1 ABC transporter permease [Theionarchaea archaeon]
MKIYRCLAVTKRVFRDLKNDRRTPALMFLAPLFAMFVFGVAFSGDVKDVPVIVVNADEGSTAQGVWISLSEEIISQLDRQMLDITTLKSADEARNDVEHGRALAAIVFPEHFTQEVITASFPGEIQVIIDRSNPNVANPVLKSITAAMTGTMQEIGQEAPITIHEDSIFGKNASFMDYFFPGILSFVAYLLTILLTLITFVGERVSGTLDRLLATPLRESEIVTGYALAFGLLGTLQSAFLLTVGVLVFKVTVVGNVAVAFVVIALLAVVSQSLGILLSGLAKREVQAIQFFPFVVLPAFLLSGIFWPIEAIPSWLRPASYMIPPTYAVDACRDVMLRGWGLEKIWIDIVALVGFASLFLMIAVLSLRRRD